MQDNFRVWESNTHTCPFHIVRRIAARAFQFNNINILHHFFKYRSGVTTEMEGMILDRPYKLRYGAVRAQFPMKRPDQIITCGLSNYMIHDIGVHKLNQKNNPTESSFVCKLNNDSLNILYISLFHALNAIAILVSNILEMD